MTRTQSNWKWAVYWLGTTMDGQSGDCIVIHWESPDDEGQHLVAVIDAGKGDANDNGDLSRLLRTLREDVGTTHIDYLIGTHPDEDHISNFGDLMATEDVTVGELWMHSPADHLDAFPEHELEVSGEEEDNVTLASINTVRTVQQKATVHVNTETHPVPGTTTSDGVLTVLAPSIEYYRELLPQMFDYEDVLAIAASASLQRGFATQPPPDTRLSLDIVEDWDVDQLSKNGTNGKKGASNNSSLIILMKLPGMKQILFTGDAGVDAFAAAKDDMAAFGFDKDKLRYCQLAHHGSWHSTNAATLDNLLGKKLGEEAARTKWNAKQHHAMVMAGSSDGHHPSQRVINAAIRRGWRTPWVGGEPIKAGTLALGPKNNFKGDKDDDAGIAVIEFDPNPGN